MKEQVISNLDAKTVEGFGEEWGRFDQAPLTDSELTEHFERYFSVFPWAKLPHAAVGFDLGCGSGRWAKQVATRVGFLHCIEPSGEAMAVAKRNLALAGNVEFHAASVADIPLDDNSMDFGYSLGVLHHIPDTSVGIASCVKKLKPGAPILVYLYYAFDNRPVWFRALWKISNVFRKLISSMPFGLKTVVTDIIAALVYFPLARFALLVEKLGFDVDVLPLSIYRSRSFYSMRTDSLDRFGTRLEHRFTRVQIKEMMEAAELENIEFSDGAPYWCAVGYARAADAK